MFIWLVNMVKTNSENFWRHWTITTHTQHMDEIPFLYTLVCGSKNNHRFIKIYPNPLTTSTSSPFIHLTQENENNLPLWLTDKMQKDLFWKPSFEYKDIKIINQLKIKRYPFTLLQEALNKVRNVDKVKLLRTTTRKDVPMTMLISNYNPKNPNLLTILKKYEGLILMTRKQAIKPEKIHVTFSRSSNLRDLLVKAEVLKPAIPNHYSTLLETKM